jgi:very-short-patch-repair endonuclease
MSKFAVENKQVLIKKYVTQKKSVNQIAEEFGNKCYPNKILRALKFLKIEIRTKSESTKLALDNGRKKHPTLGKKRTDDVKLKISEGRAKAWDALTETQKTDISNKCRERWEAMTDEKRDEIRRLSNEAIRVTSTKGSNLELFVHEALLKAGYDCYHHRKILDNEKLEVDLLIPSMKVVIEIDGPAHFLPIWGEESLNQHIKADSQKNGLLVSKDYTVIRVRCTKKSMSDKRKRDVLAGLIVILNQLEVVNEAKVMFLEV